MNNAQKLQAAIARVEAASADLLRASYRYGQAARGSSDDHQFQKQVHDAARRYSSAIRSLQSRTRAKS